jgi:hypothetical protein
MKSFTKLANIIKDIIRKKSMNKPTQRFALKKVIKSEWKL